MFLWHNISHEGLTALLATAPNLAFLPLNHEWLVGVRLRSPASSGSLGLLWIALSAKGREGLPFIGCLSSALFASAGKV